MPTVPALRLLGHAALAALAALPGCAGDDPPGPSTSRGALLVTTRSAGPAFDPDGYALTLDSDQPRPLGTAVSLRIPNLTAGAHRMRLGGIASNCTLEGGTDRVVEVVADRTTETELRATCGMPTGRIELRLEDAASASTAYSASLDGATPVPIRAGQTLTFDALADGVHSLNVTGFTPLCGLAGGPHRTVATEGDVVRLTLEIVCLSPLGGRLLITSVSAVAPDPRIVSIRRNGSDAVDLSATGSGGFGQWSPDGSRIVFHSCRDGMPADGFCRIYVMDADGAHPTPVGDITGLNPAWSPDGRRIVFSGNGGLFVMNADGSALSRMTTGRDEAPAWSPDGSTIAFSRLVDFSPSRCVIVRLDPACPTDLMTVKSDGTNLVALTRNQPLVADYAPAWSPDGGTIAFVHVGDRRRTLLTRRLDALAADTIPIDADVGVGEPVWSPDGRAIAFTAWRSDGTSDIGIVPIEGGTPLLIERSGSEYPSDWR
jgi:Tol biopolymer transport system component